MTYERLLKLVDIKGILPEDYERESLYEALHLVVKLHKPTSPKQIGTGYVGDRDMCSQCKSYYPCPTVQVIEKELS